MNLDSKLKQGWLQLLQKDTQLLCITRNVKNVAKIKTALKNSLNCHRCHQKHVECQPARMKKDEQTVQNLILCMDDFDADPFNERVPELRSLQSGVIASPEVLEDLWNALEQGEKSLMKSSKNECFLKDCL